MPPREDDGDAPAARERALHDALHRVRHLKNAKLENQKAPAELLLAVEATLAERADDATAPPGATQYVLALDSLLAASSDVSSPVYASALYLLATVLPHAAPAVVRAKSEALLPAVAQPLAGAQASAAPGVDHANALVRSALGCVEAFLDAVPPGDCALLERQKIWRTVWDLVLVLCVDARPKVRRRAQELVQHTLGAPAWHAAHPYAARTAQWAVSVLESVAASRGVARARARSAPEFDKRLGRAKHAMSAAAVRQLSAAEGSASTGMWVCALLKGIVRALPPACAEPLVPALLALLALENPFLSVAVLEAFDAMFRGPAGGGDAGRDGGVWDIPGAAADAGAMAARASAPPAAAPPLLRSTVDALRAPETIPAHTDVQTLPAYLGVIESCMVALSRADGAREAWALVPEVWAMVMDLGLSASSDASRTSPAVRTAARNALLALARYCVPDDAVRDARGAAAHAPLVRMLQGLRDALGRHALRYAHARAEVLQVLAGLIGRLRYASDGRGAADTALDAVEDVAQLRAQRDFDARGDADAVLGAAIEACGPRAVLARLPLNLLDDAQRPNTKGAGRAWLLPLLRAHVTNAELAHFADALVPLSEALFELRVAADASRPVEAKVFEALLEQIWACFPAYCDLARDVDTALSPVFLELLLNVVRSQPALRPSVLQGLARLAERAQSLAHAAAPPAQLAAQFGVDQTYGQRVLAHLQSLAGVLLAALFNLLTELPAQARGYVMECIGTYLGILDAASLAATFRRVADMLTQSLQAYEPAAPAPGMPEANSPRYVPPVPHTMLDLLLGMVPYVAGANACALADLCDERLLRAPDGALQKRTYRILARLVAGGAGVGVLAHRGDGSAARGAATLLRGLADATGAVQAGAARDRLELLHALVPHVAPGDLGLLGTVVPEAILGTKEANQGARTAAYALLVAVGVRMQGGGQVDRGVLAGGSSADAVVDASVNELVMMVAAGLAGASARMVSASITALARLLYEFHTDLPAATLDELLGTMVVYLESTNREIVKSALGCAKVAVVVLDAARVEAALPELVPVLLAVRETHRNHFKGRVRHLLERLIRRFGVDAVDAHVDAENKRLVTNIRRTRERARRRRASDAHGADRDADAAPDAFSRAPGSGTLDAFEEALYGSASDDDDDDDDDDDGDEGDGAGERAPRAARRIRGLPSRGAQDAGARRGDAQRRRRDSDTPRRRREDDAYLVEDDDAPMDLVGQSAHTAIRAGRARAQRRPGQEAASFATADDGRLQIGDDCVAEGRSQPSLDASQDAAAGAGTAFVDRERGVDGFSFRRGGAVRFNKNNKRTHAAEREDDDDADDGVASARAKRPRAKHAVGAEFRAKRASGDVQKGGVSPYAYVPLSSVAGKKNVKNAARLQITGKRK
ncbi:pre-rRNA processing protein [Malassezia sp. CBS 17886]|nr:pre-rRNA processing protein [Malassezia sp. CBS 17886]